MGSSYGRDMYGGKNVKFKILLQRNFKGGLGYQA
jgi:hypothetical protein